MKMKYVIRFGAVLYGVATFSVWSLFQIMLIGLKLAQVGEVAFWYWWYVLIPTEVPFVLLIISVLEKSPIGQWIHNKVTPRTPRKVVDRKHLRVIQ